MHGTHYNWAWRFALVVCLLSQSLGCASWRSWAKGTDSSAPQPRADLVESDETLKQQLRPHSEKKRSRWDLSNYLDPRTQSIEDNLGL